MLVSDFDQEGARSRSLSAPSVGLLRPSDRTSGSRSACFLPAADKHTNAVGCSHAGASALEFSLALTISTLPKFARACGHVSVGRYPDKRPDSRLRKLTTGPAAGRETGSPRAQRGTRLEATTERASRSRRPSKGRHRRGLSILAGRAERFSRSNPRQHRRVKNPSRRRVSIARHRAAPHPVTPAVFRLNGAACASSLGRGERHDRAHPRLLAQS
jgi:hypothetical protein